MNDKFINVPKDEDTTIYFSQIVNVDGVDALHQKWRWDGISAESLIFSTDSFSKIDREEIVQLAFKSGLIENIEKITYEETDENFVFVNFNFTY